MKSDELRGAFWHLQINSGTKNIKNEHLTDLLMKELDIAVWDQSYEYKSVVLDHYFIHLSSWSRLAPKQAIKNLGKPIFITLDYIRFEIS